MAQSTVYDSARPRVPVIEDALELLRYRDLLLSLVKRDLTVRYKRSVLGFVWTMLNPLLMMVVLTVVFSTAFRFDVESYPVYLLSGLLLWQFFSQSTTQAMHQLVWAGSLVNKIYIPKAVFVVSPLLVSLVNFMLALIPLVLIMLVLGHPFTWALLFLPVSMLLIFLFALGVGLFLTTFAVLFTDIIDIYGVALAILMYMTPLLYPITVIPAKYQFLLTLNPMYYFVQVFRQPIYLGVLPDGALLLGATVIALVTVLGGWWFFTNRAREFAYRV